MPTKAWWEIVNQFKVKWPESIKQGTNVNVDSADPVFLLLFDPPPVVGVLSLVGELTLEKMVKALLPSFKACVFVQISMGVSYNALLIPECVYYICLYRS